MSEPTATIVKLDPALLERHVVSVKSVVKNPWNPNVQDERTFAATRESIREFGFIDPVIGRPKGKTKWEIIDGEHRWLSAIEEGYEEILLDSIGPVSDATAKRLTIILNETRGEADVVKLGKLLADIQKEVDADSLMLGLPYTKDELDHLLSIGEVDWSDFKPGGDSPEPGGGDDRNGAAHIVTLSFDERQHERWQTFAAMLTHEGSSTVEVAVLEAMKTAAENR